MIFRLRDLDKTKIALAGGKGANLGELNKVDGINVPDGFCISTEVFAGSNGGTTIPQTAVQEIDRYITMFGENTSYAVRSSATAEDLPTASFAGQYDTFLNVVGRDAVLAHVKKCWASLYTDRAVAYRKQNGFDHNKIALAVIVQKMVFSDVSGVVFTADPVSSNRKVLSIDASFGLGEALVSGHVNPDSYNVRNGEVISKRIQSKQALTDQQILQLERIGRKIESHFGRPQDIEWCLVEDTFHVVQSRPITTLFPIPESNDSENRVYVSVGHQQMMTDAMKPLGISIRQLTGGRYMHAAGGRLFVDVTPELASPSRRDVIVNVLGKSDPLMRDAFVTILERDFIKVVPDDNSTRSTPPPAYQTLKDYDRKVVNDLISRSQNEIEELKMSIKSKSGTDLFDFISDDIQKLNKSLSDPQSFGVIMTAMNASYWINDKMEEWLGEKNVADIITLSVPNNVTSEMGLALLDVADVIRPYPEIILHLQNATDDIFLDELLQFNGGAQVRDAINAFLDRYGVRCAGEIDITRTRWSERPVTLIATILSNIKNLEPDSSSKKFERGRQEASKKEQELLSRLRQLPDGEQKATETKRMIDLVRNLAGYREYPKYAMVCRYFIYKQALLAEAQKMFQDKEDIYYLTFEELRAKKIDPEVIQRRKDDYKTFEKLTPPRLMTSDGEIINGKYKSEHRPVGAIAGLAVSSGVVEGRARVILKIEDAYIEEGDILVTTFTDPSWTPLFISINGLITEVGGLMTHGAVIAREYGLPAVVGVEGATKLIKDGQRIRVNGTHGYVELI